MGYEVFISYKCSDENGNKTPDFAMAEELYNTLTNMGYNTFFSSNTLEQLGSSRFKADIDAALDTARVMIVVLSKAEYAQSHWVQYEWDSFYNDYLSGVRAEANLFTLTSDVNICELPRTLRNVQNFDHKDGLSRLCEFVKNDIPKEKMFDIVKELEKVRVVAPVKCRDVVIENVCGTGVNIIATRSLDE